MDWKAIGKRIRARRRAMDMTQAQLAEAVGVCTSFIGHIENGSRVMSLETFIGICRVLGVPLNSIVGE